MHTWVSAWKQGAGSRQGEAGAANGAKDAAALTAMMSIVPVLLRGAAHAGPRCQAGRGSSGQRAPSRARGGGCKRATREQDEGRGGAQIERSAALLRRPPGLDLLLERGHRGVHRLVEALAHTLHRVLKPTPQGAQRSAEEHAAHPAKSRTTIDDRRSESASRRWLVPVAVSDAVTKNCGLAGIGAAPSAEGGAGAPGPRASCLIYQLAQHTRRGRRVCPTARNF